MSRSPGGDEEEYVRVGEAAAILHVSPQTLSRWASEGKISFHVTIGGHRRFRRRDIERLLHELQHPKLPDES